MVAAAEWTPDVAHRPISLGLLTTRYRDLGCNPCEAALF